MKNKISFTRADDKFLGTLNSRVEKYFLDNSIRKTGTRIVHLKSAILLISYLTISCLIFCCSSLSELYLCYFLLGPLTVFVALNIGHEAAHNIFCSNKKLNNLFVYAFDLMGANGRIWKYKHVHSHHLHTNIHKVDLELKQPKIVRIFPQSKHLNFHRFQHLYMPLLYSIYTLIWFGFRDFKDFLSLRKEMHNGYSKTETLIFFSSKLIFINRMIILPTIFLPFTFWEVLAGFLFSTIVSSVTVTFALISTHVGEHSHFPEPDEKGKLPHSWVRHQFLTTSDFSTENRITTELYAGFNHHLTHHLFPFISHANYPQITKIISEVSQEFNIPTHPQPSIKAAIGSHFRLLKNRAREGKKQLEWMEM